MQNSLESSKQNNEKWVDGLKGILAIVIAFFWHYKDFPISGNLPFQNIFLTLFKYGGLVVEVFFSLSGFGMIMGYESKIYNGEISFGSYIKRRISKIYPLFLETLLITLILNVIFAFTDYFTYPFFDAYHFFLNVILLQSGAFEATQSYNGPSWFISIVICMYVLLFLIIRLTRDKIRNSSYIYVYIFIAISGGMLYMTGWNLPFFNSYIARGLLSFFIGCAIAKFNIISKSFNSRLKNFIGYTALVSLVSVWVLSRIFGYETVLGNILMYVPIVFTPLLMLSIICLDWLKRILSIKPLLYLGRVSMSLYLIHHPLMNLIMYLNTKFALNINYSFELIWLGYMIIMIKLSELNQIIVTKVDRSFKKWITNDKHSKTV
ncbi:MAG: acyltransferase [Oscillospiraceae bacterium]|nr:acyltransferase [Oscillospiraceae bacterium]